MGDLLRIVTLSGGGKPIVEFDLDNGETFQKTRDSFTVTPAAPRAQVSQVQRRFGGGLIVGETHENAQVSWSAHVRGNTPDGALANISALLGRVTSTSLGRLLEWLPAGGSNPMYFEIVGPGTWTPKYKWVEFAGAMFMDTDVTLPVSPLARGLPMRVAENFLYDTTSDWTYDAGAGTMTVSSGIFGKLTPTDATEKRFWHSARGYRVHDIQATALFTTGATIAGHDYGVTFLRLDADNYLLARVEGNNLRITKCDNGVLSNLASVAHTPLASTSYWVRGRLDGGAVYAEVFTTDPGPMTTPTASTIAIFGGVDATKYGGSVLGDFPGVRLIPTGTVTEWKVDNFAAEPFAYRDRQIPTKINLSGAVPGDVPALVDVTITPSGGAAAPVFALVAWANRRVGFTPSMFAIQEAETSVLNLSGWAVTADAGARGGNALIDTAAASADVYTASWLLDPNVVDPDEFSRDELRMEVWARVLLTSTLQSPKLTVSARPEDGLSYGAERFTEEYGAAGKILARPTAGGDKWLPVKLGTLNLSSVLATPRNVVLWLAGTVATGSSGRFGVDYLWLVPARRRALSPTVKPLDAGYPKFVASTAQTTKTIRHDLSGAVALPPKDPYPDHGLGGALIEFPPGDVDALVKLSSVVPDDPAANTSEQTTHQASVRFDVTPRWNLVRGS